MTDAWAVPLPPPEPDAERLIVRITPEKGYHFPPVPAAA
jgi:hypothetical protein